MTDEKNDLDSFTGIVKLFPLPNLVLYPSILQPLHIFEPRYRQMTEDALQGDRHIALALLQSDWESEYLQAPAIHPVVCLARMVTEQRLDDGRFNILVRGLKRAKILQELPTEKLYRSAEVELLQDRPLNNPKLKEQFFQELMGQIPLWFPDHSEMLEKFHQLIQSDMPVGAICDIVSFAFPFPLPLKQELLEETQVELRVKTPFESTTTGTPIRTKTFSSQFQRKLK